MNLGWARIPGARTWLVAWALAIVVTGCEKKPVDASKPSRRSAQRAGQEAATQPTNSLPVSVLPEATRFKIRASDLPTSFPADLPDNPEIPKPTFPGLSAKVAREVIATYVAAVRAPDDADKVGELGMIFYRLNSATETVKCFSRAVKLAPRAFKWRYYLAIAYESAFDASAATAALKEAEALDPSYHAIILKQGDLARSSDPKAARAHYDRAMKLSPGDSRIYYGLGQCDLAEGRRPDAVRNFMRAVELAPRFGDAHRELMKYYRLTGDQKQSDIHQALADQGGLPPVMSDPLYIDLVSRIVRPEPLLFLSKQLVETRQAELAIRVLERSLKWDPEAWDVRLQLGVIYLQNGRYADAEKTLREVLLGDPSQPYVRSFLAQALIELGRLPEADKLFNAAMQAQPDDPEPFARYADFLLTSGRAKEAEEMYGRLTRADPGNVLNHLGVVSALICQKKYDQAAKRVKTLQHNVREGQELAEALVTQLAFLFAEQRRPDTTNTRKAVLNWAEIEGFGDQLAEQGLLEEGRKLRSFLPTLARSMTVLADRGEFSQAIRLVQRVIIMDRGGRLRDAFRTVYLTMLKKNPDSAAAYLRECIAAADASPNLAIVIAWILATCPEPAQRDGAKALSLAEKACAITNNADPEYLDTLAAAYAELGRFDEAVKTVQQAIQEAEAAKAADASEQYKARRTLYMARKPCRPGV